MAEAKVGVVITAEDRASAVISGIQGKLESMRPALQAMAAVGSAAFAALTYATVKSVQAAAESERVQAQLGAVIKSTGMAAGVGSAQAISLASSLQSMTAYSDEAVLSAENILLTFTNIGKDVFPQTTQTVLDMSTALGQDLQSSAIQLGKALQDPITGITALRRVGVNFTDDQQKLIASLVETGDLLGAQKMILSELATEFGGSATANATTFSGAMANLTNKLDDVNESIGNSLLPSLNDLVGNMGPVVDKIKDWIDDNPRLTATIVAVSGALAALTAAAGLAGLAIAAFSTVAFAALAPLIAMAAPLIAIASAASLVAAVISDKLTASYREQAAADDAFAIRQNELADRLRGLREPIKGVGDEMKAMSDKTAEATQKIIDLDEQILKVAEDHINAQEDLRKKEAETIVEQQKKISEIQKSLKDKDRDIDEARSDKSSKSRVQALEHDYAVLQNQLKREKKALEDAHISTLGLDAELAEAKRRAKISDFERKMEDIAQERLLETTQYNEKIARLNDELAAATRQKGELGALEVAYTAKIAAEEKQRLEDIRETTRLIKESMEERTGGKKSTWGVSMSDSFGSLSNTSNSNSTPSMSSSLKVNDGIVQNGQIITTHPDDYIIATKTPGSLGGGGSKQINININGAVMTKDAARELGRIIMEDITRQMKPA